MINIYVVTGFLGSGKTTFLNYFLRYHSNAKNLVIENEFGKVNIDSRLITEKIDELVELTNGCLCCSLDNELIEVLAQIIKKENRPDNVFIETTGIADTSNIIGILKSTQVSKHFELQTSICLVDAENVEDRLSETYEVAKQVSVSDVVILNKLNNVSMRYSFTLENLIASLNPFAKIMRSYDGSVNFEVLNSVIKESDFVMPIKSENFIKKVQHKINTVYFETTSKFNLGELSYALNVNFLLYPHQLFRLKGFVNTGKDNARYLLQSTGKNITFTPIENGEDSKKSELVFIGLKLSSETVQRILRPAINN